MALFWVQIYFLWSCYLMNLRDKVWPWIMDRTPYNKWFLFSLFFYRIQDVCLIFALISLVLSFFSTYAFQVSCLSSLFPFKSLCTFVFQYCLYVIFGWTDWTAVWPVPSYNYHQHNISHPDYHLTQLVAKWTMGTSTGAHMARWSDLAVCYPETLWVVPMEKLQSCSHLS